MLFYTIFLLQLFFALSKPLNSSDKISKRYFQEYTASCFFNLPNGYNNRFETREFTSYVSDLSIWGLQDSMRGAEVTGIWMFYENEDYNPRGGNVVWLYGSKYEFYFPEEFNRQNSLRYAGVGGNEDTINFYRGQFFTGKEMYSLSSITENDLNNPFQFESLIVTGKSYWTIQYDENRRDRSCCLKPTFTDRDSHTGQELTLGIFPKLRGDHRRSLIQAYKGCYWSTQDCSFTYYDNNKGTYYIY